MRKTTLLSILLLIFIIITCSGSKKPVYEKGSPEYVFLTSTADSLQLPVLNPENTVLLIKTNEFTITNSDIMTELYGYFYNYRDRIKNVPATQLQNMVLRIAIQKATSNMLAAAAKENDISVSASDIEAEIDKISIQYGGKENLENLLAKNGITLDTFRKQIESSRLIDAYFSDYYYKNVPVPEEDIKKWYNDYFATVRHILLMTQNKSEEEKAIIHKKMERILQEARSGKDFAELAKLYSEDRGSKDKGGLYEHFSRGDMVEPFDRAAFTVPIGSISDIVTTQYGYHILKIINRSRNPQPYEEVKKDIYIKIAQQTNPDLQTHLIDSLKQNIEYEETYP